jgi:hypothetical protein
MRDDVEPGSKRGGQQVFKVVMVYSDGTRQEDDDLFETESEAEEHGLYLCSCYSEGAEILHLSNPGDYPLDDEADFQVVEV